MKTICPNCGGKLTVNRLICTDCQAEYPIKETLSPYDFLNTSQAAFLETFLKCRGNLKSVGEALDMSYPTVKKNFDDLLIALGYMEENEYEENFDMDILKEMNLNNSNISDIIKQKIYEAGGKVTISLLDGKPCHIAASNDGRTFTSDKLNHYSIKLDFEVFDCIVELLRNSKNHKAPKGNAPRRRNPGSLFHAWRCRKAPRSG